MTAGAIQIGRLPVPSVRSLGKEREREGGREMGWRTFQGRLVALWQEEEVFKHALRRPVHMQLAGGFQGEGAMILWHLGALMGSRGGRCGRWAGQRRERGRVQPAFCLLALAESLHR